MPLPTDALTALARGVHANPFAVLGPHREDGQWRVRAVAPGARDIELRDAAGEVLASFECVHAEGVFEALTDSELRDYRLHITYEDGLSFTRDDPYRFGPVLGDMDLYLLGEGTHQRIYETLGAHPITIAGVAGVRFAVWAPNARRVSVVGDFNGWDGRAHVMRLHPGPGIWELFVPGLTTGVLYKYELLDALGGLLPLKNDPQAHRFEGPPGNASIVYRSTYQWQDDDWMSGRARGPDLGRPISIYEVHAGSWRRRPEENDRRLSYRELADELVAYVKDMGFTHVEFLPLNEHPFDGSWGYQPIGLYAPTHRFGDPDEFRFLVDRCHAAGIGVIVDWVPAHFPRDEHGIGHFDGTALYEHNDPRQGTHADWGTLIFNYGRREVVNYLLGSALYWIDELHVDGLRVDAVASMLYLDYSREEGEWIPNRDGGNENLEAVAFLRRLNEVVHERGAETFAEESTAWPGVSRPTYSGGLGFTYKWNMGWMNDSLAYMAENPVHRRFHHDKMTFGLVYAFNENFVLPLSHDEVVHGKRSLLERMPGDDWQRFANLRAYFGAMYAHPGKKLLFMGCEFAQRREWNHDHSLDWHLLDSPAHAGVRKLVRDLNRCYSTQSALHALDFEAAGFEWLNWQDSEQSVLSWLRRDDAGALVLCVVNFTPVVREGYRVGVPEAGAWAEILNTDAGTYGGSGIGNAGRVESAAVSCGGYEDSIELTLPPLAALYLQPKT